MADIVIKHLSQKRHIAAGQAGYFELDGIGQFNGTDASGTLNVQGLQVIKSVQLTGIATAPLRLAVSSTNLSTDGTSIVPTSGKITILQDGTASGNDFAFRLQGY